MNQTFARYAKDLLEPQIYPEVRREAGSSAEAPYDVTGWSLGMLLGVNVHFVKSPLPSALRTSRVREHPRTSGGVTGRGPRFGFAYKGADTAIVVNRLLAAGARVEFDRRSGISVANASRQQIETLARDFGLAAVATDAPAVQADPGAWPTVVARSPRVGVYAPWTGGNVDEGWTRWVLEEYEFAPVTVHNDDIRAGRLRQRFDAIVIPDQPSRDLLDGHTGETIREEYRGGLGEAGVGALARFVADGGTLVLLGAASDLAIDRLHVPVRNVKRGMRREQHFAPGTIVRLLMDPSHPLAQGMAPEGYGFYSNSPLFAPVEAAPGTTIAARFPAEQVAGSGWLHGEPAMAGRPAVVAIDSNPGRIVLFGIRPQHRGQTHATFPLLFNTLYLAAAEARPATATNQ